MINGSGHQGLRDMMENVLPFLGKMTEYADKNHFEGPQMEHHMWIMGSLTPTISMMVSAKRTADAMTRIANALDRIAPQFKPTPGMDD